MNKIIVENVTAAALADTKENLTESMIFNTLHNNGKVTLEEANFFQNMVDEVITEAAEDFIPSNLVG